MNSKIILLMAACAALTLGAAPGDKDEWQLPKEGLEREDLDWTAFRAYHCADDKADLPRVLLIGDSICNGYEAEVAKRLEGVANVTYLATAKPCTASGFFTLLETVLDLDEYAVIHFNTGCHGGPALLHTWGCALDQAMTLIEKKQPQARYVWVTITGSIKGMHDRARGRNEVALDVARGHNWRVNNLYKLMESQKMDRKLIWSDMLHFSGLGVEIQAKEIDRIVREELKKAPKRSRPATRSNVNTEFITWRSYYANSFDRKRRLVITSLISDPFVWRDIHDAEQNKDHYSAFLALSYPRESATFKRLVDLARREDKPSEVIDRIDAKAYPFAAEEAAARAKGKVSYALGTVEKIEAEGMTFYPMPMLADGAFGYTGRDATPCSRNVSGIKSPFKELYRGEIYGLETVEVGGLKPGPHKITLYLHFGYQFNFNNSWKNGSINEEISANGKVVVPRLDFGKVQKGDFWQTHELVREVEIGQDGKLVLSFRQMPDNAGNPPMNQSACFLNGLSIERK